MDIIERWSGKGRIIYSFKLVATNGENPLNAFAMP
jgi:hypothetical protein